MRHRITFQSRQLVANAEGEDIETYRDHITVWASIEPLTGKEFFQAKQENSSVAGKIRTRHLTGLQPTMRITFGNRVFNIVAIANPGERNVETLIWYSEALD